MSPAELSAVALLRLLRDLRRDCEAMDARAAVVAGLRHDLQAAPDASRAAVLALNLHHYYTAVETALSRVVRAIEGDLPVGDDWHAALVEDAARPLEPLRPALLRAERLAGLAELRRFRHFLRNAYAAELDPGRLSDLAAVLESLHPGLAQDLDEVMRFLESVSQRLRA